MENKKKIIILDNKFRITDRNELEEIEEKLSKKSVLKNMNKILNIDPYDPESFNRIHKIIFEDIYSWAGENRKINISKGKTSFIPSSRINKAVLFTFKTLKDEMAFIKKNRNKNNDDKLDKIIKAYIDNNYIHKFREGNGRTGRLWLNLIFKKELNKLCDFSNNREWYMTSVINDGYTNSYSNTLNFVKSNLIDVEESQFKNIFMKNIDASYKYEGQYKYVYDIETESIIENKNYENELEQENEYEYEYEF